MISGDALALLGSICRFILLKRYPEYSTLVTQPQWEKKVKEYIGVLNDTAIPRSCKRGHEPWLASGERVAKAFNTSKMNLTGGAFTGFENLVLVRSLGRHEDFEVQFKVHPLEEAIRHTIMVDNPREKRNLGGKESWWAPLDEIRPIAARLGYSDDELDMIADMGHSREIFQKYEPLGRVLLYCRPINLDEMKDSLKETLTKLKIENAEFKKLPGFQSSFNFEVIAKRIDQLKDETDYDALQTLMYRESELMYSRIDNAFALFADKIANIKNSANNMKMQMRDSREVAVIKNPPTASSRWCADLSTYIVGNLDALVNEAYNNCLSIDVLANVALTNCNKPGKPLERVVLLLQGWNGVEDLNQQVDGVKIKASTVLNYLREYDQWLRLLSKSDEVHRYLVELKKEPSYEGKASELIAQLDTIWQDISTHLQTRNVTGLDSHKQFYEQLEKLDEERKKFIQGLRSAFEEKKKSTNGLLQELDLGPDYRCKEVFNPDDIQGCYARLHDEAAGHIEEAVSVEKGQTDLQRQELLYTRDILSRLSQDDTEPLAVQLDDCAQSLDTILVKVSVDWVLQLMEGPQDERSLIKDALQRSREIIRSARIAVRQAEGAEEEKLSPEAEKMLEMIPHNASENLKQLILGMMKSGRSSSEVLDASLNCLAELFRKGKIRITVERHKR